MAKSTIVFMMCSMCVLMACEAPKGKIPQLKIPVSQADANASVKQQFPKKHALYGQFNLEASNPNLTFKATPDKKGEVWLKVDLNVTRSPIPLTIKGDAMLSGKLRYDAKSQTLYLEDNQVKAINVKLPSLFSSKDKKKLNDVASNVLKERLKRVKLYKLDAKKHNALTRSLLKKVSVTDGKLYLHFGV